MKQKTDQKLVGSHRIVMLGILVVSAQLLTGCDAYFQFEMFRLRLLLILFVVTLIIGIVGLALKSDR